jgi:hypothetical protein
MLALFRWSLRTATIASLAASCRALPEISTMGNAQKVTMELSETGLGAVE